VLGWGAGFDYWISLSTTGIGWAKRIRVGSRPDYASCGVATNPVDERWHHVAAVTGPGGMRLYMDGVQQCAHANGDQIININGFTVGRAEFDTTSAGHFDGNVDDVRFCRRVLTAAEIARLAAGGQ
jgi:hypothetical protein